MNCNHFDRENNNNNNKNRMKEKTKKKSETNKTQQASTEKLLNIMFEVVRNCVCKLHYSTLQLNLKEYIQEIN